MNDSDVGYDFEWNGWMNRPDLTNERGWVVIQTDGSLKEFEKWSDAVGNSTGTLMSKLYYENHYVKESK